MAAQTIPVPEAAEGCCPPRAGRAMTRCECSGAAFADIVRQVEVESRPLGEVLRRTGCGQTCTACLPDLQAFLSSRPTTLG
jgi:bacterioferritin-associated ferredoxin